LDFGQTVMSMDSTRTGRSFVDGEGYVCKGGDWACSLQRFGFDIQPPRCKNLGPGKAA
jgi:hypothetical protein